jgi:hypothetical protein
MCFEAQNHESVLKRLRPELGATVASIHRESEKGNSRQLKSRILSKYALKSAQPRS